MNHLICAICAAPAPAGCAFCPGAAAVGVVHVQLAPARMADARHVGLCAACVAEHLGWCRVVGAAAPVQLALLEAA